LYNITHAIRLLIIQRCETTLSWDQLRSPQISQFLVKPIQSEIRKDHFNRATLCALIANCLQFHKEGQSHPGNVGVLRTRALVSELLSMRLLREFSTWELIDALSYDFNPLQGMVAPEDNANAGRANTDSLMARRAAPRIVRVSTIEVAIRAEAKRFLAHPLVVQHLEAIWSGKIVFHSEQDNLHRSLKPQAATPPRAHGPDYGTAGKRAARGIPTIALTASKDQSAVVSAQPMVRLPARRSVTLYDPRDASLFKLSRLRVPRYRQVFSTLSFATMLVLFVAVLSERSLEITPLEILFWFWSAGYMLDEVVGFTEQGFGLYILSFWNAFDLGILLLFGISYCLRLYGVLLADGNSHRISGVAYDVLASTAILLFPRLFGVLDHYRYFSQLLIAFRLMAQDLIAILVLILIFCSGFFVAFTLAFSDENIDANGVAYIIFQIVMGFTPAAWDHWAGYNILGKAIMAIFLIICHFLIVTILITVLTNSFMAIVKNAEEEHQFLFAINTISMVKSDALFSYVAPANIIGWILSPIRYIMPMSRYVKFNRTIIKVTHSPILFIIFLYERIIMARSAYVPTDLVEQQPTRQKGPVAFSMNKAPELFSPGHRMREPSIIGIRKDRALEEVFRRPFQGDTGRTSTRKGGSDGRDNPKSVVDTWMQFAENQGGASPPLEQPRSVLERLEYRRPKPRRLTTTERLRQQMNRARGVSNDNRSTTSDPDGQHQAQQSMPRARPSRSSIPGTGSTRDLITGLHSRDESLDETTHPGETDADDVDGDNESRNELSSVSAAPRFGESAISIRERDATSPILDDSESEYFQTPLINRNPHPTLRLSHAARARLRDSPDASMADVSRVDPRSARHSRNTSSATILYSPVLPQHPQPQPQTPAAPDAEGSSRTRSSNTSPAPAVLETYTTTSLTPVPPPPATEQQPTSSGGKRPPTAIKLQTSDPSTTAATTSGPPRPSPPKRPTVTTTAAFATGTASSTATPTATTPGGAQQSQSQAQLQKQQQQQQQRPPFFPSRLQTAPPGTLSFLPSGAFTAPTTAAGSSSNRNPSTANLSSKRLPPPTRMNTVIGPTSSSTRRSPPQNQIPYPKTNQRTSRKISMLDLASEIGDNKFSHVPVGDLPRPSFSSTGSGTRLRAVGFLRRQRERERERAMGFRFPAANNNAAAAGAAATGQGKKGKVAGGGGNGGGGIDERLVNDEDDDHDENGEDDEDDDEDEEGIDEDEEEEDDDDETARSDHRLSRILLARMNTLELGFAEILREMRVANAAASAASAASAERGKEKETNVRGKERDQGREVNAAVAVREKEQDTKKDP
jgi:hypothetical protein